ncbi:MAG: WecB/TagA/CpsF family glycosyltransferase, partial [Armatimonadota bacterium]|nr:WecB/TagA/CpsF family glycosyltransferase [Armatimonadota bacterium]
MSGSVPQAVVLLGVPVHPVTMDEAVERVHALLRGGGSHLVVTLNAPMLGRAARDEAYRRVVQAAALVTPDGMGTLLVGRILGRRLPERVAGVDLADRLCALCAREGFRVFFLGASPGVAEAAAARLRERHPGLPVAGTAHGYFSPAEEPGIV